MLRKAVFLTNETPFPPRSGAKIRDSRLIQFLAEHLDVEVLCFPSENTFPGTHRQEGGVRLTAVERRSGPIWKRAIAPLRHRALNGFSETMAEALRQRYEPGTLLWVSRLAMAQYIPLARTLGYRIIFDEQQVESAALFDDAFSSIRALPTLWFAAQCGLHEGRTCSQSDAVVAASDLEASRVLKLVPRAAVHVIPNSVDAVSYASLRAIPGNTLLFTGSLNHEANVQGLGWFVDEVLPRLRAHMGAALPRVVVAGSNPSEGLRTKLTDARVELHANPASITPFLAEAAVVFNPLQSGGNTRINVLEAMAAGRAVVSTGKGVEGLVLSPTYDIWVADRADPFASAVSRFLENPRSRAEIGTHAAQTVERRYDWSLARERVGLLLQSVGE